MSTTPLDQCHQCKQYLDIFKNPWTFHAREENASGGTDLVAVVRFCGINCIAAYYKLMPWPGRVPTPGGKIHASDS